MLTETDASLLTIRLISDLDRELTFAAEQARQQFHVPASAEVRCVGYESHPAPIIEAYLEIDICADFSLSFHMDVRRSSDHWIISRSIQKDAIHSENLRSFEDVHTSDMQDLARTVLACAGEGVRDLGQLAAHQQAA
ncbi:MAG TPA: hypothetical protein VHQ47_14585 [Phycisphaerae bacterium]|nr:hypothetical protein [Phycisphaerae bacterium]